MLDDDRAGIARLVDRGDGWKGYSTFTSGLAVGPDGTIHLACNIARGKVQNAAFSPLAGARLCAWRQKVMQS